MPSLPYLPNSGMNRVTGSFSRIRPSSTSCHHARRRRHDLGERGEVEDGVFGHRLGSRLHGALAERAVVDAPRRRGRPARRRRAVRVGRWRRRRAARSARNPAVGLDCAAPACAAAEAATTACDARARARRAFHAIQYILSAVTFTGISGGFEHASASSSVRRRAGRACLSQRWPAAPPRKPAASAAS